MKEVMKREVLVERLEKVAMVLMVILLVMLPFVLLMILDESEKNKAIERCSGEENLIEKYTAQGDTYYECREQ